ncbi:MAG: hypothetical protein VB030_04485 [Eubacterium aggregans]|uniref:hypothetical protein n=1 Tax=Eubacterium aggregans TaxID=81409 RepID=UPI002B1F08E7|nr:hypothetical protein [Eubacterium aggregans]MEA5073414.1 hypothetical protein [Eubacterium aggregans]
MNAEQIKSNMEELLADLDRLSEDIKGAVNDTSITGKEERLVKIFDDLNKTTYKARYQRDLAPEEAEAQYDDIIDDFGGLFDTVMHHRVTRGAMLNSTLRELDCDVELMILKLERN